MWLLIWSFSHRKSWNNTPKPITLLCHMLKDWRSPEVFGLCCSLKDMTVPTNMHSLLVEDPWITKAGPSFFSPQSLMVVRNVFTQVHKGELGLLCFSNRLEFSKKSWHGSFFFFFWNKLWSHAEILSVCGRFKNSHLYVSLLRALLSSCHLLLCLLIMCEQKQSKRPSLGTRNTVSHFCLLVTYLVGRFKANRDS